MDINNLVFNFLGDSITEGAGASSVAKRFTDVFAQKTSCKVNNYGIGGTRIARQKKPSLYPIWDRCYLDRVEEMDPNADVIVIFGGTNDFGHGDAVFGTNVDTDEYTFYGAMRSLLTRAIEKYPTSRIIVMTPLHRESELVRTNEIGIPCHQLVEYVDAEIEICREFSVPVLDLWSISGIQPRIPIQKQLYTADGLHPNDRGHELVADLLISFLKTI